MHNAINKNSKTYTSTGGAGDHERLSNRRGAGPDGAAHHLSTDEKRFFETLLADAPLTPTNIYPMDNENNVYQFPEFIGSEYRSPKGTPMLGVEIAIASDADLQYLIYTGYIETELAANRFPDFEALITVSTSYFWSIRYVDTRGIAGNWSVPTLFTTAAAFEPTVVITPQIDYPTEDSRVSPIDPLLVSSPFTLIGGTDTHESSSWQLSNAANFEPGNIIAESLDDTQSLTAIVFPNLDLEGEHGFYSRVRHKAALAGESRWSPIRHAWLRDFHDSPFIGVAGRPASEGGVISWRLLNLAGETVKVRSTYWDKHSVIHKTIKDTAASNIIVADQHMVLCPEFYVRTDHGKDGDDYRFFIGPAPFEGASLHPMFLHNNSNGPIYWGKYLCGNATDTGTPGANSLPGYYVRQGQCRRLPR
jgi:hypothetical protein